MSEKTGKSDKPEINTFSLQREALGSIKGEIVLKSLTGQSTEWLKDYFEQQFWVTAELVHNGNEDTRTLAAIVFSPM